MHSTSICYAIKRLLSCIYIAFANFASIFRHYGVVFFVTFDQNVKNAISAEFGNLAVSLPDWWFLRTKGVIGTFSQTVKAGIF